MISVSHLVIIVCALSTLVLSVRDPYKQPFSSNSIWNLPIGKNAVYKPATLHAVHHAGCNPDGNIIVTTPKEPPTPFLYCTAGWNRHKNRCVPTDKNRVVTTAPLPSNFVIPGTNGTLGGTPNACGAFLAADNRTIIQTHPVAKCTANGPATSEYHAPSVDMYGAGTLGAFGGSGLSSIGGTIRVGEWVPGAGPMRHALKLEFNSHTDYYNPGHGPYFRWPAVTADGYAPEKYGGKNPAVQPGSLLALNQSIDINNFGLQTEPAKQLAWTLQNYGGYIVADAAWDVWQVNVEYGPKGYVGDQFEKVWGFPIFGNKHQPWVDDTNKIFLNLAVVDNWDKQLYERVSSSSGAEGAGGGPPLQPWASPIHPDHP